MRRNFADQIVNNADFQRKLRMFSVSDVDARNRAEAYKKVIQNTLEINGLFSQGANRRGFAGASVTAGNIQGSTIYGGVLRSFINSIAPIFATQRAMDTPQQQLMVMDAYGLLSGKLEVPNIGADNDWLGRKWDQKGANPVNEVLDPSTPYNITSATPLLPRTLNMEVYKDKELLGTITDDGAGHLMATPGILADNGSSITYDNTGSGSISITWSPSLAGLGANRIRYTVGFDVTSEDQVERAYFKTHYYNLNTEPLLVPVERNIVNEAAMRKQGIINTDEMYANFIESEYTKVINNLITRALTSNYEGDTWDVDLTPYTLAAGLHESLSWGIKNSLVQAENELARKTYKGAKTTGILAGHKAVDVFNMMGVEQGWVRNTDRGYYKDIVGWVDEAPVVLGTDGIAEDEVIITTRTEDGQVSPLMHGIFLAPTDLPVVANYSNITQYTNGLYSMEGVGYTTSDLCLKMKFDLPTNVVIKKK